MIIQLSSHWQQFALKDSNVCASKSCKFYTSKNSLIIDCDKIKMTKNVHGPINDYIAFEKDDLFYVGIVEFKGKRPDYNRALSQLCSGKHIAEKIIKDSAIKEKPKMYMITVAKSNPASGAILKHKKRPKRAKRKRPKADVPLVTARCGDTFSDARRPRFSR